MKFIRKKLQKILIFYCKIVQYVVQCLHILKKEKNHEKITHTYLCACNDPLYGEL